MIRRCYTLCVYFCEGFDAPSEKPMLCAYFLKGFPRLAESNKTFLWFAWT